MEFCELFLFFSSEIFQNSDIPNSFLKECPAMVELRGEFGQTCLFRLLAFEESVLIIPKAGDPIKGRRGAFHRLSPLGAAFLKQTFGFGEP